MTARRFRHGDHVIVGEPGPKKVHWVIEEIVGQYAVLRSPMSGRTASVLTPTLTLHTEGSPA